MNTTTTSAAAAAPQVPPGFRFHPTDEELVDYYLRRKITSRRIDLEVIKDVDLYKIEPWDLKEICRIGQEEQSEWYFFSHKDKKYPTGTRTNRATAAGFWKATGRDKPIYSKNDLIGMRKTLVFYKGRAPNGLKSDWIMHEYRLETDENGPPQEEGWVVCRVFMKRIATIRKLNGDQDSPPIWYDDHVSFMPEMDSPPKHHHRHMYYFQHHHNPYISSSSSSSCATKWVDNMDGMPPNSSDPFLQLPYLESPKMPPWGGDTHNLQHTFTSVTATNGGGGIDHVTDWRVLDKFVASQLSQADENDEFDRGEDRANIIIRTHDDSNDITPSHCDDPWK